LSGPTHLNGVGKRNDEGRDSARHAILGVALIMLVLRRVIQLWVASPQTRRVVYGRIAVISVTYAGSGRVGYPAEIPAPRRHVQWIAGQTMILATNTDGMDSYIRGPLEHPR